MIILVPNNVDLDPGHSTVHYLDTIFALLDTILKHFEKNGAYFDALFAETVEAFDNLDLNIVVEEAKAMGARPFVVQMPASFLFERVQFVQFPDHELSEFVIFFVVHHKGLS